MKNHLFSVVEPRESLRTSIINKIKREEIKRTIYKIAFSSVVSLASVSIAVIYAINIVKDAYQSGLSEYLSLLSSDGALIASYWQTYVMSIVESLPIIPITIVVASVWVFVWSINSALEIFRNTKPFFYKVS
jgi:hypothetical protein